MRVTYAINARIAGGGIGNIAYHALAASHRRRWLQRLIVSTVKTPEFEDVDVRALGMFGRAQKRLANYDATQTIDTWGNALFDRWASRQIPDCDIFHGWSNHTLHSLRSAHQHGAKTIVERGGSHVAQTVDLLREEFMRWGWHESVMRPQVIDTSLREFDETDYIMVPSQYNVDSFTTRGFPRAKLLLLPMGVNTQRFTPPAQLPDKPFRAIFVGQVSLRKGIQYVLHAWRKAALSDAELIVAGEVKADAVRAIAPYRSDPTIRWQGHVSDPVELYQSVHVFVFPSIEEGSALVSYEAMACGLPSIVTHNAGSLIRDGVEGWIVPLRDSDSIAERLSEIHLDPTRGRAMGRAAREASEAMNWGIYQQRLATIYEDIATRG